MHVEGAPALDPAIYDLGIPILGICYGVQLMAQQLGGAVGPSQRREYGPADIIVTAPSPLFDGVAEASGRARVWMSHGDSVSEAPAGFTATAKTVDTPIAAFESEDALFAGVQFHPELKSKPFQAHP